MRERLERVLAGIADPVIAVSGGVDSLTLAALAGRLSPGVAVMHAVSPAVPDEATRRVRGLAQRHGWRLTVIDAGEFSDPRYRANPLNRCFFCKTSLYGAIRARTDAPILSGANLDDLGEYRPGLDAAREHGVRHPYVESGIDKNTVRSLARELGLGAVAELPASPCLASRVETGIRIETPALRFIHDVERLVGARLHAATVRCRLRAGRVAIELDAESLRELGGAEARRLTREIEAQPHRPAGLPIVFEAYRNGSAFLREAG